MRDVATGEGKEAHRASGPGVQKAPAQGLIHDVRNLLAQNQQREGQAAGLESSVQELIAVVREDLKKNDNERQAFGKCGRA